MCRGKAKSVLEAICERSGCGSLLNSGVAIKFQITQRALNLPNVISQKPLTAGKLLKPVDPYF